MGADVARVDDLESGMERRWRTPPKGKNGRQHQFSFLLRCYSRFKILKFSAVIASWLVRFHGEFRCVIPSVPKVT